MCFEEPDEGCELQVSSRSGKDFEIQEVLGFEPLCKEFASPEVKRSKEGLFGKKEVWCGEWQSGVWKGEKLMSVYCLILS